MYPSSQIIPWVPEVFLARFPLRLRRSCSAGAFGRHFRPPRARKTSGTQGIYLLQFNGLFTKEREEKSHKDNLQKSRVTPYKNKSPHKNYKNYNKLTKNCNNSYNFVTNLITLALNLSTLHAEQTSRGKLFHSSTVIL